MHRLFRHSTSTVLAALDLVVASSGICRAQSDSSWRDHDRAATAAKARGDWTAYRYHVTAIGNTLDWHPLTVLALARAETHLGDTAQAFRQLQRFAAMGLTRDLAADSDFVRLHGSATWTDLLGRIAANGRPVFHGGSAFALPDS